MDPGTKGSTARTGGWRRRIGRWVLALTGIYALWCVGLYFFQDQIIFPVHMTRGRAHLTPQGWRRIDARGTDGASAVGLLWMPVGASADQPARLAVGLHGNAELAEEFAQSVEVQNLRELGFAVLVVEYRGYGAAAGSPSQKGIVSDAAGLMDACAAMAGIDARGPLYLGRSLGGGVACALAAERPPAGMILVSTFRSVASFAAGFGVPAFLVRNPFHNDRVLEKLDAPVLVFHGSGDEVVPVEQGRRLGALARRGEFVEVNCGHLDFPPDAGAYERRVGEFLAGHGLMPRR